MRAIYEPSLIDRLNNVLDNAQGRKVTALVVSAAEYEQLGDFPSGPSRLDPLCQRSLDHRDGRYYVGGIPIYYEGEPGMPEVA